MRKTIQTGKPSVEEYDNINKGESEVKGIEVGLKKQFIPAVFGFVNYSYQNSEDKRTGEELEYVPENKFNLGVDLKLNEYARINAAAYYVGKRPYSEGTLDNYMVINTKLIGKINENFDLSLTIYNLFDENYQETIHYPMPGREWQIGLSYKF